MRSGRRPRHRGRSLQQAIHIVSVGVGVDLNERLSRLRGGGDQVLLRRERRLDRVVECLETAPHDILVLGPRVFAGGGILEGSDVFDVIAARFPGVRLVCLLEAEDIAAARRLLRAGTYRYGRLPISDEELQFLVEQSLESRPPAPAVHGRRPRDSDPGIIGRCAAMQQMRQQIEQAAATDIPVLILGETGTGKDLVARQIHRQSARRSAPYLAVNMGATPADLIASELFGHEKGAFTGAVERHRGTFEQGDGGTVFLDEVGTIEERVQVSLLRLIEERRFFRLGGRRQVRSDVRVIAATNADLAELVAAGEFRQDLYYRLDVFRISVPPLRERPGDIALLIEAFVRRYTQAFRRKVRGIAPECVSLLEGYGWPGNVRELKNVLQRAVLMCPGRVLLPEHLPERIGAMRAQSEKVTLPVGTTLRDMEREMIVRTLAHTGNNRKRAAEVLGISRRSLYNRLERYGIE